MRGPIVERIKELCSGKQCHECEFSSCRGVGEDVILRGQFGHDRLLRGLGFFFEYGCGDSSGRTGLIHAGGHVCEEEWGKVGAITKEEECTMREGEVGVGCRK